LIKWQATPRLYGSGLQRRLQPAAVVGTIGAVFVSPSRLHHRSERKQASEGDQVGDDQEEIKRHRSTGSYRIRAWVSTGAA
jgi:hypothetical protein